MNEVRTNLRHDKSRSRSNFGCQSQIRQNLHRVTKTVYVQMHIGRPTYLKICLSWCETFRMYFNNSTYSGHCWYFYGQSYKRFGITKGSHIRYLHDTNGNCLHVFNIHGFHASNCLTHLCIYGTTKSTYYSIVSLVNIVK